MRTLRQLLASVAILCTALQASAHDFVVDQSHWRAATYWVEYNAAPQVPFGQEFTPTFSTLNVVDLMINGGYDPGLSLNIREGTITGPIVGASSSATQTPESLIVQFDFASPITLVPNDLYVMELIPVGPVVMVVTDGGSSYFAEDYYYPRGDLIVEGQRLLGFAAVFRTGSSHVPGVVYHTGFEDFDSGGGPGERPWFRRAFPLNGVNGWTSPAGSNSVRVFNVLDSNPGFNVEPHTGDQALSINGVGLVPLQPGLVGAAATRHSDINPIANGNPIVFFETSVKLNGPSTDLGGGINDDLISANTKVVDENGATVAQLILSSNGYAYAFANDQADAYNFATPAALGEYHTVGLRLDYRAHTTDYFLDEQYLGTLPFGQNIQSNVFAQQFLELIAVDSPALNKGLYRAWFDDFSIRQSVPEPANISMFGTGVVGWLAYALRRKCKKQNE